MKTVAVTLATPLLAFLVAGHSNVMAQADQSAECVFTLQGSSSQTRCLGQQTMLKAASLKAASANPGALPPPPTRAPAEPTVTTNPPSPEPPISPTPKHPQWELQLTDVTLYAALNRWAKSAGWRVFWDADKHLLIDSPDLYMGSFEQVVTAVMASPSIVNGPYPLEVCFYPNTPPLARITKRGEQAKDCM